MAFEGSCLIQIELVPDGGGCGGFNLDTRDVGKLKEQLSFGGVCSVWWLAWWDVRFAAARATVYLSACRP